MSADKPLALVLADKLDADTEPVLVWDKRGEGYRKTGEKTRSLSEQAAAELLK